MICKNCKNKIPDDKVFCPNCGEEVRFVPDYNVFEEDIISSIIKNNDFDNESLKDNTTSSNTTNNISSRKNKSNTKLLNKLLDTKGKKFITPFGALFIIIIIFLFIHMNSYGYCIRKAKNSIDAKKYERALQYAKKALKKKETSEAYLYMGEATYLSKDTKKAVSYLKKAINLSNTNKDAYKYLIDILKKKQNYKELYNLRNKARTKEILSLFDNIVFGKISFKIIKEKDDIETYLIIKQDSYYDIYYTKDGSNPSKYIGKKYTTKIHLKDGKNIIKAVCVDENGNIGKIYTKKYKVVYKKPSDPIVNLDSGIINEPTKLSISSDSNCRIFYTWDGTDPTIDSSEYIEPIEIIEGDNILSIISINERGMSSNIVRKHYTYEP